MRQGQNLLIGCQDGRWQADGRLNNLKILFWGSRKLIKAVWQSILLEHVSDCVETLDHESIARHVGLLVTFVVVFPSVVYGGLHCTVARASFAHRPSCVIKASKKNFSLNLKFFSLFVVPIRDNIRKTPKKPITLASNFHCYSVNFRRRLQNV